jgi:uncharacterized membrane protein YoaT (DUF817 family)
MQFASIFSVAFFVWVDNIGRYISKYLYSQQNQGRVTKKNSNFTLFLVILSNCFTNMVKVFVAEFALFKKR